MPDPQDDQPSFLPPSADEKAAMLKAANRDQFMRMGKMGDYYQQYPHEAPAGYWDRDSGR